MAEIKVYNGTVDLPMSLRWQVLDFMRIEWQWLFSDENRLHPIIYPEEGCPMHFVVSEGEVLISHAMVIEVQLDHAGQSYRVAGLGNVLTYPSFRGEGYGSQVVRAATQHIMGSGVDVGALFCVPERAGFYGRHGWEAMEMATTLKDTPAGPAPYDALRMMVFVSEKGRAARDAFEQQPWYVGSAW